MIRNLEALVWWKIIESDMRDYKWVHSFVRSGKAYDVTILEGSRYRYINDVHFELTQKFNRDIEI